jgi:hypothetical protein
MTCALCSRPIDPTPQFDGTIQRVWANGPRGPQHWPACPAGDDDEPDPARGVPVTTDEE